MRSPLALCGLLFATVTHAGSSAKFVEQVDQAQALWRRSCPVPPVEGGLCARVVTVDLRQACGAGQRLVRVPRHRRQASTAQHKLRRALARLRWRDSDRWPAELRAAAGRALLLRAEERFGNGNGVFSVEEQNDAFMADSQNNRGQYEFFETSEQLLRLGIRVAF